MNRRGRFVTLEGIDGAGKSSHVEPMLARIRALGHAVLAAREPGGTPFGMKLREVVLKHPTQALAEALVMFADRSAHIADVIEPALASGTWVVCDRFTDSTYAYQCGGNELPVEPVRALEEIVHPRLQPDITFLFDLDPSIAHERQRREQRVADQFESRDADFFRRVREAYLRRGREHPGRIRVIDAAGTLEEVRARLDAAMAIAFR